MARPRNPVPTYRLHRPSGTAYADIYDPLTARKRSVCLGPWESPASRAEYARVCSEVAAGGSGVIPSDVTLNEILPAFWTHAQTRYVRADGSKTSEVEKYRAVTKMLRGLYGSRPAVEFGVLQMKVVVHGVDRPRVATGDDNYRIRRVKRLFKWAAAEGLVLAGVFHALQVVSGLQRGRTTASEGAKRTAVAEAVVRAVLPYVGPSVAGMLELQLLTGMRPGRSANFAQPTSTGPVPCGRYGQPITRRCSAAASGSLR